MAETGGDKKKKDRPSASQVAERVREAHRMYLSSPHTPTLRQLAEVVGLHPDTVEKYAKQEGWVEERACKLPLQALTATERWANQEELPPEVQDTRDLESLRSVCKVYLADHPKALTTKDGLAVVKLLLEVIKLSREMRRTGGARGAGEDAITPEDLLRMVEEMEQCVPESADSEDG